ncbi:uncharacterized protein [Panulirus ornatus]|uniref:uncharacterized protein isoform X2 n=1 Tax=Panulirus ornatus TaxID=150431 RepID=UPI003A859421
MEKEKACKVTIKGGRSPSKNEGSVCGMSKAAFSGLKVTLLWVAYVLLGSVAFMYIEANRYTYEDFKDHHHWARFKELVLAGDVVEELLILRNNLLDLCPHPIINQTFGHLDNGSKNYGLRNGTTEPNLVTISKLQLEEDWSWTVEDECEESLRIIHQVTKTDMWSLVDSIYYTMTAVTTIGYGHLYPVTRAGRLFSVLYCLVGVPLTCILMAKSSEMLSNRMLKLYFTAKKRYQGHQKALLYGITWVYLSVGFIVFMFLPSVALSKLEEWTYEDSLYYTFITLSTIGFGDLVAGYNENVQYKDLYKMCIIVWIMLALGYWFLLLNFLQKALRKNVPKRIKKSIKRSKRITRQSEFFKQLVGKSLYHLRVSPSQLCPSEFSSLSEPRISPSLADKSNVRVGQQKRNDSDSNSGDVALMVEVADALAGEETRRASRPSIMHDTTEGTNNSDSKKVPHLTLSQLLDVNIVVRSEVVPTIRSFIAQSPTQHESSKTLSCILTADAYELDKSVHPLQTPSVLPDEVTLPLRDVLNLVTLIKSIEDEVAAASGADSNISLHDDTSSPPSSPPSTVTSLDTREFVPLLKQSFHKPANKPILRTHKLSHREEEEIEEALQAVFDDYSDGEESDTEGERDSQIEEEEEEEAVSTDMAGKDIENGNYRTRNKLSHIHGGKTS